MAVRLTLRFIMTTIELVLLAQKGGLPMPRHTMLAVLLTAALIASAVSVAPGEVSVPPATGGSNAAPTAWVDDLTPLSPSEWNADRAAHLLERAGFGGTPEEIARLAQMPPAEAVRHLVYYQQVPNIAFSPFDPSGIFPSDDFVPPADVGEAIRQAARTGTALGITVERTPGTMWLQPVVDAAFFYRFANNGEMVRVARWFGQRMLTTARPLEEKLALFWHGHFATDNEKVRDYRKLMVQWELFRRLGNGNLRDLLLGISQDPAMLIYLDGQTNVKGHPNENFARELFELFSLGVGHYTEHDIQEAARAFTGWGLEHNQFVKRAALHDDEAKTVFGSTGTFDGEHIINLLLEHPACAPFIVRKLYRFFVREDIAPTLEAQLAARLRERHYDLAPLLETIFLSRDFYSAASVATQIKSPVHLVISTYKKLGVKTIPGRPRLGVTAVLGQQLGAPPNVAGWPGGRTWITPSTLLQRQNFARYTLFPHEIPPPSRQPLDFVATIIGHEPYQQLQEMAQRGDFTSAPAMVMAESGLNRRPGINTETYNIFRGIYNGAVHMVEVLKADPPTPAPIDLTGMVHQAGVSTDAEAVDYLAHRFLRTSLQAGDRHDLIHFLTQRLGGSVLDFTRADLETDLRALLHLIMSLPEYQLA